MTDTRSSSRSDDKYANSKELPPMSRLFVVCPKTTTEKDLRVAFEKFGTVEDIWVVKDKNSGENKGVAYVKFTKTSDAARAVDEIDGTCVGDSARPIKVLVAASRDSHSKKSGQEREKSVRLFVVIPKLTTEAELREEFTKYGDIDDIFVVRDKLTGEGKGFAYVRFKKFYHAALAFEGCQDKYKAIFAEPKSSKVQPSDNVPQQQSKRSDDGSNNKNEYNGNQAFFQFNDLITHPTTLDVTCSSLVNQDQLWQLFDIVPGLDYCKINEESGRNCKAATVVYTNLEAAVYAKEKMHGLEYPPGERLIIRISEKINGTGDKLFKRDPSFCNVNLPPPAPMAKSDATVAQRCFIVVSSPLSSDVLKNAFSSFGNLIDVYLLTNKKCGYAKYASEESARRAIDVLHDSEIMGVKIKVMVAEEPRQEDRKRMRRE